MITSLTAVAAALALGLPIFALGERIRDLADDDSAKDLDSTH